MIQIKSLTITHKKDLKDLIFDFSFTLNDGDKVVIIGDEGNGKSTLLKWIYNPHLVEEYCILNGNAIYNGNKLAYLPQEINENDKQKTIYEYFLDEEMFSLTPYQELNHQAAKLNLDPAIYYSSQIISTLSGGEKIKVQILKILLSKPTVLLLDEPSNDIDLKTLKWLEDFINSWPYIVVFVSHDETLIKACANKVIHIEQLERKTLPVAKFISLSYEDYIAQRKAFIEKQTQMALNEKKYREKRDERWNQIYQSVKYAQDTVSNADASTGRMLKVHMHAIKSMKRRFDKEDAVSTKIPDTEGAISISNNNSMALPSQKIVLDFSLDKLYSVDKKRVLATDINLFIKGNEKITIIGDNGVGKTSLLKKIYSSLKDRKDLKIAYMPQVYEEELDLTVTPDVYLAPSLKKDDLTKVRQFLGSLKFTTDEMDHPISDLSGGQKAKILILNMVLNDYNFLILDEPTRNFSPLSNPKIISLLANFKGAILAISHDRNFIREVSTKVLELTKEGLKEKNIDSI